MGHAVYRPRVLACVLAAALLPAWTSSGAAQGGSSAPARTVPAAGRTFDILEIEVAGNTQLKPEEIEMVLSFFVGENKTAADVDAARAALEKLYKSVGYRTVAVTIPKQTIKDGIVQLQVAESRIGQVTIDGGAYTSIEQVRSELPSLAEGKVPDFDEVQKELVYANRIAGRRVTPSLKQGAAPDTLDLSLAVDDELPVSASLEWNNRYSRGTTKERVVANASYNNLFQLGHTLGLLYQTAPQRPDDGRVWALNYNARLPDASWSIAANALRSDSDVSAFAGLNVVGSGRSAGIKAIHTLTPDSQTWFPSISFGADYKRFRNAARVSNAQGSTQIVTPASYVPVNLSLSQSWRFDSLRLQNDNTLVFASAALGSDEATIDLNRFGARGNFTYLRSSLSGSWRMPLGFSVNARASGQYTGQPLLSGEQLGAGGMDSVRGYLESETLGDTGVLGSFEFRLPSVPDLFASSAWSRWLTEAQPYLFIDSASLAVRSPYPDASTPRSYSLMSVGGGLSVRLREFASAQLVGAYTTKAGPATPTQESRLLFRLSAGF